MLPHAPPQLARACAARRVFQKLGSQTAAPTQQLHLSCPPQSPRAKCRQDNQQDQDNSQPTPKMCPLLHWAPTSSTITVPGMKRLKLLGSRVHAGPFRHLSLLTDLQRDSRDHQTILSHPNQASREHCSHPQGQILCVCSNWCFPEAPVNTGLTGQSNCR